MRIVLSIASFCATGVANSRTLRRDRIHPPLSTSTPSWEALVAFFESQYRVLKKTARSVELRFEDSAGRTQDVRMEPTHLFGEDWVLLRADLGVQTWSPQSCLERNAGWPAMALVSIEGQFLLQTAQPLRTTDQAELNRSLRFMAHQAFLLREHGIAAPSETSSEVLAHWA